jgi:hypothetical protein
VPRCPRAQRPRDSAARLRPWPPTAILFARRLAPFLRRWSARPSAQTRCRSSHGRLTRYIRARNIPYRKRCGPPHRARSILAHWPESHWREPSTALLAPLLYAANVTERPVAEVLLGAAGRPRARGLALEDHDAHVANDMLVGIAKTDDRERSSIFSASCPTAAPRLRAAVPRIRVDPPTPG